MKTILITEDNNLIRENLADILEMEGYKVITATNGADALDRIKQNIPDLIVSDILMPEMNGYDFMKKLKEASHTKNIPFIFLTAKVDSHELITAMEMGVSYFLAKPFTVNEVIGAVETSLNKINNDTLTQVKYSPTMANFIYDNPLIGIQEITNSYMNDIVDFNKLKDEQLANRSNNSSEEVQLRIDKYSFYSDLLTLRKKDVQHNSFKIAPNYISIKIENKLETIANHHDLKINFEAAHLRISFQHYMSLLSEILDYVLKYSIPQRRVEIYGHADNGFYNTRIIDYGCGINYMNTAKEQNYLKKSSDSAMLQPYGLGKKILKRIIWLNNGYIKIKSMKDSYALVDFGVPVNTD